MSACSRISRHVLPLCRRVKEAWVRVKVASSLLSQRKAEPRQPDCPQLFCLKTQTLAPRAQAAEDANEHLDPRLGKWRRYKRLMNFSQILECWSEFWQCFIILAIFHNFGKREPIKTRKTLVKIALLTIFREGQLSRSRFETFSNSWGICSGVYCFVDNVRETLFNVEWLQGKFPICDIHL